MAGHGSCLIAIPVNILVRAAVLYFSDPAILEALACREAIALAHDLQLEKITVASDYASVISDMTKPYAGRYSTVIREIKEAAKSFAGATFRHENHASNSEAHRLARFAASAEFRRH
jgi:hypothetical protein